MYGLVGTFETRAAGRSWSVGDRPRRCVVCQASLEGRRADAVTCSDACRGRYRMWRRRIHLYAMRYHAAIHGGPFDDPLMIPEWERLVRRCPVCLGFVSIEARTDAVYCSKACAMRQYRARVAGRVAPSNGP